MSTSAIDFRVDDQALTAAEYLRLAQQVWPGNYSLALIEDALRCTINITARDGGELVGCVRILTDGYLFGTIPEILVLPAYQRRGSGRRLMEFAWERSPTSLFFGVQPGKEAFFEKLGYEHGLNAYHKRKPRRA